MISWVINIINNYKNDLQQGIYKIIKNEHGNKNGLFTIKTSKNNVTLFYTFGKSKISGAEYFEQDDDVTASYKPKGRLDFEGELVSISIKNKK